jgi:hypothetical protein
VAVIWISFLLDSLFFKKSKLTFRQALASLAVSFIGTFFGMWQAGYFVIPSGDAGLWGYGTWAMNLLSFFNAFGWSYLLPPITSVTGIHNRFQYPGIGVFILIFFALLKISTSWMWLKNIFSKNIFLLASLFALTLFAITNYVSFGSLTFHFKLPNLLLTLGNTFRGSDRMFWPSVYAIIIAAIAIICKSYRTHIALLILGCTAIVQIVDTAAGWIPLHQRLNSYSNSLPVLPFNNAFWNVAAQKYKGVIVINDGRNTQADNWRDFSRFALQNNMESGAASLARFDLLKLTKMISEFRDEAFRDNLLYIVSDEELPRYITKVQRGRDLVTRIDGYNVIAPAWLQCEQCVLVDDSDFKRPQAPFTENNKSIYFSSKDSTSISFLISGWDNSGEEWGVWSNASKARLTIPLPSKNPKNLVLNLRAFVSKKNPMQKFQIFENNKFLGIFTANKFDNNLFVIPVTAAAVREGFIDLNFNFDRPKSPKELSLGDDDRKLSIGLISATFIK